MGPTSPRAYPEAGHAFGTRAQEPHPHCRCRRLNRDVSDLVDNHCIAAELVWAADQFLIAPAGRTDDATRARAVGDEVRTVIAGYHWFTDWGRDTMISLEGLTLSTGRYAEAAWILRTFSHYVRDGLIPNLFPERRTEGLYHTADATLWFFHALDRYTAASGDRSVLQMKLCLSCWIFTNGTCAALRLALASTRAMGC